MTISERLILTDEAWAERAPCLEKIKNKAGRPAEQSDSMFLEAIGYMARTGIPWRDLPKDCGNWDAVSNRFRRWEARGIWKALWERVHADDLKVAKHLFIDSTIVRAHQHTAGALKKRRASRPSFGPFSGRIFSQNPCRLYK